MATYNFNTSSVQTKAGQRSLLSKTFTYMAIFLGITAAVTFSLAFLLDHFIVTEGGRIPSAYIGLMIGSGVAQIFLTLWIFLGCLRPGKIQIIPMILYSVCMGVLMSSFTFALKPTTLGCAFLIAALSFGGMALIGAFSKNASGLGMVGFGLLFSILFTLCFSWIFFLFVPEAMRGLNIAICAIVVIAVLCITAYDVNNIVRISKAGENSSNLALYLAFNLYTDFILILIRIIQLIIIVTGGDRR